MNKKKRLVSAAFLLVFLLALAGAGNTEWKDKAQRSMAAISGRLMDHYKRKTLRLDRVQIVETANAQAQAIVKKAEERARILVSEAEIVKAAQQRAGEITTAAQNEARTLRQTVTDYCDNMLKNTEETMVENAAQVKNVRANLRQNAKKNG